MWGELGEVALNLKEKKKSFSFFRFGEGGG
jgi:hypothetical protein